MMAKRISILYPGEMGAAIGVELRAAGHQITTCIAERGPLTRANARAAGFDLAEDLASTLDGAELIISLVPPGQATNTARQIAATLRESAMAAARPIYLDLNSISPATMHEVGQIVSAARAHCIDGVIHGQANRLREKSVLFLSGPGADQLLPLFDGIMPVRLLGDDIGAASSLKMCLGAFAKGMVALFLETVAAAGSVGLYQEFVESLVDFYPETEQTIARLLPSYPKHAARRVQEIAEVKAWHQDLGVSCAMTQGTIEILEMLRAAGLDRDRAWRFETLLHELAASEIFKAPPK